ncbi:MAG: DUF5309 family protein [Bacteroidales bacterium]|nr:DUF5309 family protein [Bacteroidales bacterium]
MADAYATSFAVLNYSGMLFNKGNVRTPLSAIIGGKRKITDHVEFVTGQEYTSGGGSQPAISEEASLAAPDATRVTRAQKTNVTQIFQEAVAVSYAKQSNMGTLSGVNIANQVANPINELDFQVSAKMQKIANDIEYTFINGVYNKATADDEINKTRGLLNAITTTVWDMSAKAEEANKFGMWDVANVLKAMRAANAPTNGLALWLDPEAAILLNKDAAANNMTIVPASREINGISLSSMMTPMGIVYLYVGEYLPARTAFVLNLDVIAPVEQPVPGKGNFFLEPLAKVGAGQKYQIFGQIGLDYGPEFYHAKITNIGPAPAST